MAEDHPTEAENARLAAVKIAAGIDVFSATCTNPWQRGSNENDGLLRQHFPKGTDLARHSAAELDAVAPNSTTRRANASAFGGGVR